MNGLQPFGRRVRRLDEGVEVVTRPPGDRDTAVAALDRPWIADEGPVAARVKRLDGTLVDLHERGLAFDAARTVVWDEDAVQVISAIPNDAAHADASSAGVEVLALRSPALARKSFSALDGVQRIDYLRDGVWLASRYLPPPADAGSSSEADHA